MQRNHETNGNSKQRPYFQLLLHFKLLLPRQLQRWAAESHWGKVSDFGPCGLLWRFGKYDFGAGSPNERSGNFEARARRSGEALCRREHLLGRRDSFFNGVEGTSQSPIAVVQLAVEIELVLDEINVPDPPP